MTLTRTIGCRRHSLLNRRDQARNHQDPGSRGFPDASGDIESIHVRKAHSEGDQGRVQCPGCAERTGTGRFRMHLETGTGEDQTQQPPVSGSSSTTRQTPREFKSPQDHLNPLMLPPAPLNRTGKPGAAWVQWAAKTNTSRFGERGRHRSCVLDIPGFRRRLG